MVFWYLRGREERADIPSLAILGIDSHNLYYLDRFSSYLGFHELQVFVVDYFFVR
jgi:hypothetical protein